MADEESRPLLHVNTMSPSSNQPHSPGVSSSSPVAQPDRSFELSSESTPLLARRDADGLVAYGTEPEAASELSAQSETSTFHSYYKELGSRIRWPIICALVTLSAIISILVFAFFAPAAVKEYAKEAAVFHPTEISIDSATADGLRTRVQGEFVLDANRVQKQPVRTLGRLVTWIGREVETGQSEVQVYLPEYGNILVGTAYIPSIKFNIRNGHTNNVDFLADLTAGDIQGIRAVAGDWLEGRLGQLRVKGRATVHLKSGLFGLGEQTLSDSVTFEDKDFPTLPDVKISRLNVYDVDSPDSHGALAFDVSLSALIDSPLSLTVPPLGFELLVPNCSPGDPHISVASAATKEIQIVPDHSTALDVAGLMQGLSDELTTACPGRKDSPLDFLVKSYMNGLETTVYVRGADDPTLGSPPWMVDILKSITVPLPFTGRALDNLIKNYTMSDVHFSLPNPFAEPDSEESQPRISALVKVLIALPEQINLRIDIPHIRADADVFYHGNKLGIMKIPKWQPAHASYVNDTDGSPALSVEFAMKNVPLHVTDEDVLTEILQSLVFEGKPIDLHVVAAVDAEVSTGLGQFAVRGIPAEGTVTVNPPYSGSFDQLQPNLESLEIGRTTETSMLVRTRVNATNPTEYAVSVPYTDFVMLYNGTQVAHITARDVLLDPKADSVIHVDFLWNPSEGGSGGLNAGREFLSKCASGANITVTVQGHERTIPALPKLGRALSRLRFEFQLPKLTIPGSPKPPGGGDGETKFIQEATMHLLSSTAEFTLFSPLPKTLIEITSVEANAYYMGQEEVGSIDYAIPFQVPPGISTTPRLPVEMNLGSIGYDALRRALGGALELDAVATVCIRVGQYKAIIDYQGNGLRANVKL
ncbi:uncharacterized protein ACLA_046520 [Aspergillus clavatus NRRL 1]|uniref:Pre-rRNA processing protein n=1 Tax=Aspergillus clavatus (strain ATCC 1007 / CBS 513.65 / DSM 816 / NCTC 3887 / NRRL 1 / QM 1276 / 107) TaxID=344612 RepID=A1CH31_ASPCL|nr:uncharacterized protein ACLA_046520 [Aspergillus clavatus NRRL 1]EAW10186.1 conserved hypothetical protein [Aspergillus clavatus NRRL 1]